MTHSPAPPIPDDIAAAVQPGHTLAWDPPAAITAVVRWTCSTCGDAVLRRDGQVYGGATKRTCEESQAFWAGAGVR